MKHYIFEKSFEEVFTKQRLFYELGMLKLSSYENETVRQSIEKEKFFGEDPKKTFELPKEDGSSRTIALASSRTKIVQRVLANELGTVLIFSDHSYAFQRGKSPYKAIMRARDYLRSEHFIAKSDIEKFFDRIDHTILMQKLEKIIRDKKILHLIGYYLSQGFLEKNRWIDKSEGVYQGDVLSPLLSNIYLNDFDFYLEREGIKFVRYSDDMLFLGKSKKEVSEARKKAAAYLLKLKLRFNVKKTYLSELDKGFEYLGIHFFGNEMSIETVRLSKKANALRQKVHNLTLEESIEKLNEMVSGFLNYYAKLIDDEVQMNLLQERLEEIVVEKIIWEKKRNDPPSKNKLRVQLETLKSYTPQHHRKWVESLISQAYEELALQKPLDAAQKRVAHEKQRFLQRQIKASELVVTHTGAFVGFSQGKLKVKLHGKVLLEAPIGRIERILILNKQVSLSAYVIHECARRKIDIDFIANNMPYALLTYYVHVSPKLHQEQLKLQFSPRGLAYAREITHDKALNQINLLKYYNRRRHDDTIASEIGRMEILLQKVLYVKDKKKLLGIEGSIAVHYWNAFGTIIGVEGFIRTHKDSINEINQALNYGYAILYNRVQTALLHEGLNLNYPLYHAMQKNKPTLVFDMVEEFRQPVVDREIIAMLNRGQKIRQNNGRLTKESIKLIVQHIQERLATPTRSRYGKTPLYNIIGFQANLLKRTILDGGKYKGFVNRY